MDAPRLTFRSPTLSVPYFSLDGAMPKQLSDQILSGAEDGGPLHKALRCVAWNPPPDSLARVKTNGTVFAFDVKFEDASLGLAWVRSDTAVVKDRLLGTDHSSSLDFLTQFFRDAFARFVAERSSQDQSMATAAISDFSFQFAHVCFVQP